MSDQPNIIYMTDENQPYFSALFMLAAGLRNANAEDTLVECIQEMLRLRHEVASMKALEAENAALREVAQAVAADPLATIDDALACVLCERWSGPQNPHTADCPVLKARALLAREPGEGTGE